MAFYGVWLFAELEILLSLLCHFFCCVFGEEHQSTFLLISKIILISPAWSADVYEVWIGVCWSKQIQGKSFKNILNIIVTFTLQFIHLFHNSRPKNKERKMTHRQLVEIGICIRLFMFIYLIELAWRKVLSSILCLPSTSSHYQLLVC